MARTILSDEIWFEVESILTPPRRRTDFRRGPGRHPLPDRAVLTGILFVLKTGIPWQQLPMEMGCGSGMTCLRRLREWQRTGLWPKIERYLSRVLSSENIHWKRAKESEAPRRPARPEPVRTRRRLVARPNGGSLGRHSRFG